MTESYEQANLPTNPPPLVAPEDYLSNKAKIAEAKALISAYEELNEAGKQSHDVLARELEQKIREGEQARELLSRLKSQSTFQVPPIRRPAIDYPSSTSRIVEVPNYDPGPPKRHPVNFPSAVHPQQLPTVQDRGNRDNHSRPVASKQEQRRVSSDQEHYGNTGSSHGQWQTYSLPQTIPVHYGNSDSSQSQWQMYSPPQTVPVHYDNSGSSQGQWQTYSPPQTVPVHAPGPLSPAAYKSRPSPNIQQSSAAYHEATVGQNQATEIGPTYTQGPLPHKTTSTISQLATALGPQPNAPTPSSSKSVPVTSPNPTSPIANPSGDRTSVLNQNAIQPLTHISATLPSIYMNHTQYTRELREAIKNWDVRAPPNSYFDHPSNYFRVHKDLEGTVRIIIHGQGPIQGHSEVVNIDQFCDWIRKRNSTSSVTPTVPTNPQTSPTSISTPSNAQKSIPPTIHKAIPPTYLKANVQVNSSSSQLSQSATHRPGYPEPSARQSSSMSSSKHIQGIAPQIATPSAPPQNGSSAFQNQLSSSTSVPQLPPSSRPLPPTTAQTPSSSASVPKTPIRQLSTIVNGVSRSAKQADKKSLASHILFGLGKRSREIETSPTALTEPQPKRRTLVSTPPSLVPSAVPVSVPSLLESGKITQPVASTIFEQPQPSTSAKLVPSAVPVSVPSLLESGKITQPVASTILEQPQLSTSANPVPSALPVSVPPLHESEEITQPIASTILEQPQPSTPAKLQLSSTGVPELGTSTQILQKNQPLFLPSPVSSPGMDANDDVGMSGTQSANVASRSCDLPKLSGSARRKNYAFVLAPRRPPYLVKYFQLKKQKAFLKRGMTSRSSLSKSVAGEEDFYNATENLSPNYAEEQQTVQLACSRLRELSCKWDGCSVKMNSVDSLIRHLNRQHKHKAPTSRNNYFLCRWTQCGRRCNFHERHLEKHASFPLICPYEDCEESFRCAPPLLKHTRAEHEVGRLKPSTQLRYPTVKLPDAVLGVIPSYMITTRGVNGDEISSVRHAVLAPRVLRDISGLERERSKNKTKKTDEESSNDYDFLYARPTRYSSQASQGVDMRLEDLNCDDISRLVDEGLTLWGGGGADPLLTENIGV